MIQEDSKRRVISALYRMGSSVFSGALTSFLGILVLGLSSHKIMINMFKVRHSFLFTGHK